MSLLMSPRRLMGYAAGTLQGQERWRGNGGTGQWDFEFGIFANAYLRFPVSLIDPRHGWVGLRIRPNWASTAAPEFYTRLFDCNSDALNGIHLYYCNDGSANDQRWGLKSETGFADDAFTPVVSFAADEIINVYAFWTPKQLGISYNGQPYNVSARNQGVPVAGLDQKFCLGRKIEAASMWLNGEILYFIAGKGSLPDSQLMNTTLTARSYANPPRGTTAIWIPDSGAIMKVVG